MDKNGYYDSDDLWFELSNAEKSERLINFGFETVIEPEEMWKLLSDVNKQKVLSSSSPTPGFQDLNKVNLDKLVDALEKDITFKSDSQSYVIGRLIDYYKKHRKRHITSKPEIDLFLDSENIKDWGE